MFQLPSPRAIHCKSLSNQWAEWGHSLATGPLQWAVPLQAPLQRPTPASGTHSALSLRQPGLIMLTLLLNTTVLKDTWTSCASSLVVHCYYYSYSENVTMVIYQTTEWKKPSGSACMSFSRVAKLSSFPLNCYISCKCTCLLVHSMELIIRH